MSRLVPLAVSLTADHRITADRNELRYLVDPERLGPIVSELNANLAPHRFTGEGANSLPDPQHFVTTVYFDTPSLLHYRMATRDVEHNVKLRAKEYYDLHPGLAELATDPDQMVRNQPWLWLELKRREGTRTLKHRFRLRKREAMRFFGSGRPHDLHQLGVGAPGSVPEDLQEILRYCQTLREPLAASCLVNYRRLSWQAEGGSLRVTVDLSLAFYAPPVGLWTPERALTPDTLGPVLGGAAHAVIEVKSRACPPDWLQTALCGVGAQTSAFSKFVAAAGVVHGRV